MSQVRAGTAKGGSVYHAVSDHGDTRLTVPRAACSIRTTLEEVGDAASIPEHHRCRRQGCAQAFDALDAASVIKVKLTVTDLDVEVELDRAEPQS